MSGTFEGTVRDLSRFGEGIAKTERGSVFAPGALPGERVSLAGVTKRGKVYRAERVQVLDASSQRIDPACPIIGRCGGCPLMIASRPLQERFRRGLLEKALSGVPGGEEVVPDWIGTKSVLGYRVRARLSWKRESRGLRLGYRTPRNQSVVDVRTCVVLHPTLDQARGAIRRALGEHLDGEGEIHLAFGHGRDAVAALSSDAAQPAELYRAAEELVSSGACAGVALRVGGATSDAVFGDPREVRSSLDGEPLVGTVGGFSQAHEEMNRALVSRVVELAAPAGKTVLELFCGYGNLTVNLAREAAQLVAVELDEAAAAACRENLRSRGLAATVREGDAELYRAKMAPDVVVLDPPRGGAAGAVAKIAKLRTPEVVYISCEPSTLARDLEVLSRAGYRLTHAVALDMFPQTAHLESVVRLHRGG